MQRACAAPAPSRADTGEKKKLMGRANRREQFDVRHVRVVRVHEGPLAWVRPEHSLSEPREEEGEPLTPARALPSPAVRAADYTYRPLPWAADAALLAKQEHAEADWQNRIAQLAATRPNGHVDRLEAISLLMQVAEECGEPGAGIFDPAALYAYELELVNGRNEQEHEQEPLEVEQQPSMAPPIAPGRAEHRDASELTAKRMGSLEGVAPMDSGEPSLPPVAPLLDARLLQGMAAEESASYEA